MTTDRPDPNEKVAVQAVHFARLLDLARTWLDEDDEDAGAFLGAMEYHLVIQAPTTSRSYAARRQAFDAIGG